MPTLYDRVRWWRNDSNYKAPEQINRDYVEGMLDDLESYGDMATKAYQRGRREGFWRSAPLWFIGGAMVGIALVGFFGCTPLPQIATEPHDAHVLTQRRHLLAVEGVTIPQSQTWDDFLRSLNTIKMSLFFQKHQLLPPYNRGFGVVTEAGVLVTRIATTEPYGGTETKMTRCLFFFGSDAMDIKGVTVDYDSSLVTVWSYLDIYDYWGRW